jgi:hypothetical protein
MKIHYKTHLIERTAKGFIAHRQCFRIIGTFATVAEAMQALDA